MTFFVKLCFAHSVFNIQQYLISIVYSLIPNFLFSLLVPQPHSYLLSLLPFLIHLPPPPFIPSLKRGKDSTLTIIFKLADNKGAEPPNGKIVLYIIPTLHTVPVIPPHIKERKKERIFIYLPQCTHIIDD
jgi:hypothetical protein